MHPGPARVAAGLAQVGQARLPFGEAWGWGSSLLRDARPPRTERTDAVDRENSVSAAPSVKRRADYLRHPHRWPRLCRLSVSRRRRSEPALRGGEDPHSPPPLLLYPPP